LLELSVLLFINQSSTWNKLDASIVCVSSVHDTCTFYLTSLVYGSCLVLAIFAICMYPCF